ncbi:transcription factor CP2 isoform X4 [Macrobrachium rosenbergii]|uniref:transcription factor CP2 isoform X4 n=1 Tax=Macrobrachium rosenbergii TaxID=79674 RepID=UPI0034D73910
MDSDETQCHRFEADDSQAIVAMAISSANITNCMEVESPPEATRAESQRDRPYFPCAFNYQPYTALSPLSNDSQDSAPEGAFLRSNLSWPTIEHTLFDNKMGEPNTGSSGSGEVTTANRTRKRILDPLEVHEDDGNARRPGIFSDWQETLKSLGVPIKKGFISMEGNHPKQGENEDIDQGLAADFDDSLSGLGVDISTASYNMSEALLALPTVPLLKHEIDKQSYTSSTPATFDESSQSNTTDRLFKFQYILGAATSIATKVNEESLSYLNQGQSYEIKVKKLGDLTSCKGKLYHTVIRVCFHERRLQYMEREQLESWRQMRPGERILEVDIPLSYGIFDVNQSSRNLNMCEFDWDPTKEVGVYIKVNCISTEFTPKKHGGEKGVPFRIQVETYAKTDSGLEQLHVCACQIKVFKLKGADRKHKQDREKILKRPVTEQEKYQPSCECTILTELSSEAVYVPATDTSSISPPVSSAASHGFRTNTPPIELRGDSSGIDGVKPLENGVLCDQESDQENPVSKIFEIPSGLSFKGKMKTHKYCGAPLHTGHTSAQTAAWLRANNFGDYISMFSNFTGTDLLRLSRSDLTEMCGLAHGVRLYYALHAKSVIPRLTVYVCLEHEQVYHAIYLENLTCHDFTRKVSSLMHITPERIHDVYLQGPTGVHILVTDQVVQNMRNESLLSIEVLQDAAGERFRLLLRLLSHNNNAQT